MRGWGDALDGGRPRTQAGRCDTLGMWGWTRRDGRSHGYGVRVPGGGLQESGLRGFWKEEVEHLSPERKWPSEGHARETGWHTLALTPGGSSPPPLAPSSPHFLLSLLSCRPQHPTFAQAFPHPESFSSQGKWQMPTIPMLLEAEAFKTTLSNLTT